MDALWLHIYAPFAAFRGFQAGTYRATSPVMPPSTAFGFLLNLAGIEMRGSLSDVTTTIRTDLPRLLIAIGLLSQPERCTLYQQLHSYRVGTDEKTKGLAMKTKGAKYQIVPVRREILVGYNSIIGVQSEDSDFLRHIKSSLGGDKVASRYGLPFLGDNNLLPDRVDILDVPSPSTQWYARMGPDDPPRRGSCRLTVGIDRTDNSKTTSYVYAPAEQHSSQPPEEAWTWTPS